MSLSDVEIEAMGQSLGFQVLDDGGTWLVKRKLPEGSYLSWVCYSLDQAEAMVRGVLKTLYPSHRWANQRGLVKDAPDPYYNTPQRVHDPALDLRGLANTLVNAITEG